MIYKDLKKRFFTSIILLVFVFFIFKFKYLIELILIIFGVLSILEFLNLSKKIFNKSKFYFLISNTLFISYIIFFSYFLLIESVNLGINERVRNPCAIVDLKGDSDFALLGSV